MSDATLPTTRQYLVVGGTTKSATTSVFAYLSSHPAVCASSMKESRFFLDLDYPARSSHRYPEGIAAYEGFFTHCDAGRTLRVEATPDYLYSPGTAARIAGMLPGVRVVFLLREPIDRLTSWYRFAQQNGDLPASERFDSYAARMLDARGGGLEQHERALEQGRYARYLSAYYEHLGPDRIRVCFLEDLAADPRAVMRDMATFAGIDPTWYDHYEFAVENRTAAMRSPGLHRAYKRLRYAIRQYTHSHRAIHEPLRALRRALEPLYLRLNSQERAGAVGPSPAMRERLVAYYADESRALEELIGRPVPWGSR